jgi:hypothetical protein
MAFAFGCGVAVGVGLALLIRNRPEPTTWSRGKETAEHFGRQLRDAIAAVVPDRLKG